MNTSDSINSQFMIFRPIPAEQLKLLVFDLDGTLADTKIDLCNSVNAALRRFHLAPLPNSSIASFIGDGTPLLVHRSLSLSSGIPIDQINERLLASLHRFFMEHYLQHILDNTTLYPGVMDAMEKFHEAAEVTHWSLAVLTNKPQDAAEAILIDLGIAQYFKRIYGGDSFPVRKPEPLGLLHIMQEVGARPDETVMIGDSKVDIQTARNAGAWSIGCSFGFKSEDFTTSPPDALVDEPKEWVPLTSAKR